MTLTVGDVMSWTSLTVRPDCPAAQTLEILADADAESLFVVDEADRFLGVLTGYELLKADLNGSLTEATAGQLMSRRPQALSPQQPLGEALKLFREAALSQVPVLREGRLLGAIERKTVLRWVAEQRHEPAVAAPSFLRRETASVND
jgi:CBS domain-containing protein